MNNLLRIVEIVFHVLGSTLAVGWLVGLALVMSGCASTPRTKTVTVWEDGKQVKKEVVLPTWREEFEAIRSFFSPQ